VGYLNYTSGVVRSLYLMTTPPPVSFFLGVVAYPLQTRGTPLPLLFCLKGAQLKHNQPLTELALQARVDFSTYRQKEFSE
jgi:hypothetical protein